MAFKDWFKRAEEPKEEQETEPKIDIGLLFAMLNPDAMDKGRAMSIPAFGASVDMVSGIVSAIPIKLYRRAGDHVEEVESDRRVELLNGDTGDTLTAPEMKKAMIEDYYTGKGGFAYVNRVGNEVKSLHYVKAEAVSQLVNEDPIFKVAKYLVNGKIYYDWQFIRIIRDTRDGRTGQSLVETNGTALAVAYLTMLFERSLVKSGGNKRGFIKAEQKLSPEKFEELKKAWENLSSSDGTVMVLNRGLDFQEVSNTSVEMQLNENKEMNGNDIYSMFKLPPSIVRGGATDVDRDNYVRYGLIPLVTELVASINRSMLLESEKGELFFDYDLTEFTKANMAERWGAWIDAKKNGLVNPDEFRKAENMPPLGIDFVNMGLQDVLYDAAKQQIVVPNMGQVIDLNDMTPAADPNAQGGENSDESGDQE